MGEIIKSVVACNSVYGMICIIGIYVLIYAIVWYIVPYIYKIICKALNTLVKYKDVHTKASVKDVSFETDLHR